MSLPLLLAGPIVRRVEPRSAAVWVAMRSAGTVRIHIWEGLQKSAGVGLVESGDAPLATGGVLTRKLGAHLHVALVSTSIDFAPTEQFRPIQPPLRPGAIYSYDISFIAEGSGAGTAVGLLGMGLLEDDPAGDGNLRKIASVSEHAPKHLALGYTKGSLPSFVTAAATLKDTRLAHASCRKSHGPGTDALSWLDDQIETKLNTAPERVQQLFLTGDQIYADDVPTCLLPMLHELGVEVIGGEETLPHTKNSVTQEKPVTLETAPPMRRTTLVRTDGGFTSVEAQNHLLTFGEYAAMYLLAWSTRVWRQPGTEDTCYRNLTVSNDFALTKLESVFLKNGEAVPADFARVVKERNTVAFKEEQQRLIVYASTVAKVARVLANTSTYMIFDDHDVTDDWNLNATWRNRVLSRPFGCALMRNAMVAYTFFQAWGSDPRSFDNRVEEGEQRPPPTPNMKLMAAAVEYLKTPTARSEDKADEIDRLLGIKTGGSERAKFHYEAVGPLYQVRVLDSRTRRTYPFSIGVGAPFLLGSDPASSLSEQLPKGPRKAGTEFLLVVASTPVLGPELLERMLIPAMMQGFDAYRAFAGEKSDFDGPSGEAGESGSPLGMALKRSQGAMFIDGETWPANEQAQHELLNRLATYERVIVLGGDVHYGTNFSMDWFTTDRSAGAPENKAARIVQLTSSAARNAFEKRIEHIYQGYHWLNQWMFGATFDGFAWKDGSKLSVPAGANLSLLRHSRMKEKPSMLPAYGWPEGTSIPAGSEPDWSWRMTTKSDERPESERDGPFKDVAEQLEPDLQAARGLAGVERARAAASIHQKAQSAHFAPVREVVFTNNVGVVTFETDGNGDIVAVHTLYSTDEKGYPEDEPDEELVTARPLGVGAHVSNGKPNTVVRLNIMKPVEGPPVPRRAVR